LEISQGDALLLDLLLRLMTPCRQLYAALFSRHLGNTPHKKYEAQRVDAF
jgi:hypothetical protein